MNESIRNGNKVTVKAGAAINAQTTEDLKNALKQALTGEVNRIVIDLAETKLIDSIGLGLLAATHN